ncbi:MAG: DNA cytosine methyltransferase [Oscillospiraceae bacterium]
MKGQINIFDEIIVDNFAGGGGASTGIELALGKPVTIAINHDPAAILMHKTNHPHTIHFQASVWDVDPMEVCGGRPVGLAWFSPDCKHFSKAKGSALVDRNIRGLAWIVLRWAGTVRPRVIILENVEEFQTWGPVRKGKPIKRKSGQTFQRWLFQIRDLGYAVEYRELVAADYGAPTTRKRFVLIARCDGQPIRWPERTHAPRDSEEVKDGKLLPWRSAAEIIDWSLPMYSIFETKEEIKERYGVNAVRPLADNTMRRIIRGVDKHTIKSGSPFLVECNHSGAGHIYDAKEPIKTITQKCTMGLASVNLIQYHTEQTEGARTNSLSEPMPTVDASNRYGLVTAHMTEYYGNGEPIDIRDPLHTVTSHDREALTSVVLHPVHAGGYHGKGNTPDNPLNTITAAGGLMLAAHHITEFKGQDIGQNIDRPLRTITASAGEFALTSTIIRKYKPGQDMGYWPKVRALLNKYCGYNLADDEVLLIRIGGAWWFVSDIKIRMLAPKELYAAMGFPLDYIIDRDYTGKAYPKSQQVARCGNAVCPPMARAVVAANMPEYYVVGIDTMAALERTVAV